MMTDEFDKVFTKLEAPEYPATCDQCGVEGTNASMDEHVCDESPASLLDTAIYAEDIDRRISARVKIVKQHTALIEQRERLITFLRDVGLQLHALAGLGSGDTGSELRGIRDKILSTIISIEQETGVK